MVVRQSKKELRLRIIRLRLLPPFGDPIGCPRRMRCRRTEPERWGAVFSWRRCKWKRREPSRVGPFGGLKMYHTRELRRQEMESRPGNLEPGYVEGKNMKKNIIC